MPSNDKMIFDAIADRMANRLIGELKFALQKHYSIENVSLEMYLDGRPISAIWMNETDIVDGNIRVDHKTLDAIGDRFYDVIKSFVITISAKKGKEYPALEFTAKYIEE